MEEGYKEGLAKGIEQGIEQGSITIAKNLLNLNLPIEYISKATNLSIEEIEKLK